MNHDYSDIRSRISEPPLWWDESAVPRYAEFAPERLSNIYAREAALVLIACQACGTRFQVALSMAMREPQALAMAIRDGSLHYGDPPNIGCCPAGPTMNCDDIMVLQYWHRPDFDWIRDSSLEISIEEPLP